MRCERRGSRKFACLRCFLETSLRYICNYQKSSATDCGKWMKIFFIWAKKLLLKSLWGLSVTVTMSLSAEERLLTKGSVTHLYRFLNNYNHYLCLCHECVIMPSHVDSWKHVRLGQKRDIIVLRGLKLWEKEENRSALPNAQMWLSHKFYWRLHTPP